MKYIANINISEKNSDSNSESEDKMVVNSTSGGLDDQFSSISVYLHNDLFFSYFELGS